MITNNVWHTLTLFYTQDKIDVCVNITKVGTYTLSNGLDLSYAITYLGDTSSTTKLNGLMEKFVIYRDTVSSQENMLNTLAKTIKTYDKKT